MWKIIRDWLCPIILEQEKKLGDLKKVVEEKERDIMVLTSKQQRWERDFKELNNHHEVQMEIWETRFKKMIAIIEENDLLTLGD